MAHVDCLSRIPQQVLTINITEGEWLLAAQMQDEEICRIRDILMSKEQDSGNKVYYDNYEIRSNIVYRKIGKTSKWLVPRANRWQICRLCHDDQGHFGLEKTMNKIQENYWFPKLRRFVTKYVNSCLNCLYYKAHSGKRAGQLYPIEKVTVPYHTLHIDHLGPFIKSRKGNTQLLVMIDGFTKFTILEPVRNTKTKHVVKCLKAVIDIFGVPIRIITDRGTAFTSKTFQQFCLDMSIKHVQNAVATPRANGQCERVNRTVLSALAALTGNVEDDMWDTQVKTVQRGLNTTVHKALGTTPSEVLFGSKPRGITDAILLSEIKQQVDRADLVAVRSHVKDRIDHDQKDQKKRYDRKRAKAHKYKVDDLVMVEKTDAPATGQSRKLLPKYKGPYRVTAVLPNDRYAVTKVTTGKVNANLTIIAIDKLKPWITLREQVTIVLPRGVVEHDIIFK